MIYVEKVLGEYAPSMVGFYNEISLTDIYDLHEKTGDIVNIDNGKISSIICLDNGRF